MWSWTRRFEDLSGVSEAHCDNNEFLKEMLTFAGEVYLPFLAANSSAIAAGDKTMKVNLWRENTIKHEQPVFKYQDKCYSRLKKSFTSLPKDIREDALFKDSGCLQYLQ